MPRLVRRPLRRILPAIGVLALLLVLNVPDAGAILGWCAKDPVVKIDGRTADIWVASHDALHEAITGPIQIVVTVPAGVPTELLAADLGFGKTGYAVAFVQDPALAQDAGVRTQVRVAVFVPATDPTLPVRVDFAPRSSPLSPASAIGTVNSWVWLTTR